MKKNKFIHIAITSIMLLSTVITPQMSHAIASMQADENDETSQVEPSDVEATNEEAVSDLEDGSEAGDSAEVVDLESNNESEEAEDEKPVEADDEVADGTPEDINNNDPPVEEVEEAEEVEAEVVEEPSQAVNSVTPMSELGNIFDFEYFKLNDVDVEDGAEIEFNTPYHLQYKWDTAGKEVKAGDTARLTLPDVFKQWPDNTPPQKIITSNGTAVGTYTVSNGELVFTFDENIEDAEVHNGFVGFNVEFDNEKFLEEWEQEIDFDGNGEKDLTVVAKPNEVETKLEKEGHPDSFNNAREITWSVDITNGNEEAIDGILKDSLPEGVGEPRDFVVKEFAYDFEGNKILGEEVSFNEPTINGNEFEMTFDNVPARGGYTVEYKTSITDKTATQFTNDATFVSKDVNLDAKTTVTTGERSNPIQKNGSYNWSTGQIDWTIIVNENGEEIDEAIVHDTLPEELTLVENSIHVTKNWNQVEDLELDGFPIELGKVNADEVYRINFSTDIDWSKVNDGEYKQNNQFTNETELTDGEDPIGEDEETVDVWRKQLLIKSGNTSDYNYEDKVLSWTIVVNEAKHPISKATVTDILPAGIDIAEEDILIKNEADEEVSAENIVITKNEDGTTKLNIELGDIGTEKLTITYTTEVEDFEANSFTNEATLDGEGIGEDTPEDNAWVEPPKNSYKKEFKSIDYNEKTIDWSITVDPRREAITELEIEDTFPNNGMILLPDSVVVKIGETELASEEYTLVPNTVGEDTGYNKGFTIKLNNISEEAPLNEVVTVDFKTSYDPQLEVEGNTADDHTGDPTLYTNHAAFTGKTINDHDIDEEDDASTHVRQDSWNSGKKEGQRVHFDEEGNMVEGWESGSERKIAWQVYTNYQKQNLGTGVSITDVLDYEGTIDEDSIVVSVYEVSPNGETTITEKTVEDYTVSVDGDQFTLTFDDGFVVDERYVVEFTTTVPDISQKSYKNNASVKVDDKEYPYSATVNYDKWNDYLDKQALGQEGTEVFIGEDLEWEVTLNEGLSVIKDAVITDTISAGLAFDDESLVITTGSDAELTEGEDYSLEVTTADNGETVLKIAFSDDVTEALTLNYTTVVIAENGQQVNNKVDLNGSEIENKSKETDKITAKQFSWVGGDYNPNRGAIAVEKVDSDGNVIETGEATFELYFEMNDERVLVGEYKTTNGTLEIPNLPLRTYYLVEVEAPEGYVLSDEEIEIEVNKNYGTEKHVFEVPVTNYKENEEPELIDISVQKEWEDADNQDGIRPDSITVKLLADGEATGQTVELNAENNWQADFSELDVYADGEEIEYTIEEVAVEGYETTISGSVEEGYVLTNTHEPELINVEGTKTWNDADNQDGKRPESITVRLLADGEEVESVDVTAETDWAFTFTDLPKFKNGTEINYTVQEDGVKDYSTAVDGFNITNSYTPKQTSVNVVKAWEDANNQDGIRPDSITVKLLADGEATGQTVELNAENNWQADFVELDLYADGEKIEYTVEEVAVEGYETTISGSAEAGFVITNTHEPELINIEGTKTWDDADNQDGKRPESITVRLLADGEEVESVDVTAEMDWTFTFTNLPKFKNGTEINYTVQEDGVEDYSTAVDGFNITNSYTPKQTSVNVVKVWEDAGDQDGIRPDSITVKLLADGEATGQTVELNAENNWQADFVELDVYADGEKIEYTVEEVAVEGYETTVSGSAEEGYVLTNTHEPEETNVSVIKEWNDEDNLAGFRPNHIDVELYEDGKATGEVISIKANEEGNWVGSFDNLPKYRDEGTQIEYTVKEINLEDLPYSVEVIPGEEEDDDVYEFTLINTHEVERINIDITKTWDDADNQDGKRPESITVRLLADGEEVESVDVTAETDWAFTFTDLPKFKNGTEINYTVQEDGVEDYSTAIDGFNITNSYTPKQTSVNVVKAWEDANNQDGIRPDSITVKLLADGEATGQTVELNAENNWQADFVELDLYADGEEIEYTVEEVAVEGYETTISGSAEAGFVITNTHKPEEPEEPEKPQEPEEPGKETPDDPDSEDPKDSEESDETELPKTGEAASYTLLAIALIGLGFGVVYYKRRRTNE